MDSSSQPSSLSSQQWEYDVYPSFVMDVGPCVLFRHLLTEFGRKGIRTSTHYGGMVKIEQGLRRSRIAIVILSSKYASSSLRLIELVEIMKCKVELGQIVVPIFYNVNPIDVRKQTGDFGKKFSKTCKGETKDYISKWRRALEDVSDIAGYQYPPFDNWWSWDAGMIDKIVIDISKTLMFEGLVGMEAHIEKMESLLCLESREVRMIGIVGPPGIGKTTIARCLFKLYSSQFDHSFFMEDINGLYPRTCYDEYDAKLRLQSYLLSSLLKEKDIKVHNLAFLQDLLLDKRVLVVVDDVDSSGQLDALVKYTWFGSGSRIIITTRDKKLLNAHGINLIYEVEYPSHDDALKIFSMNAFGKKSPSDGFENLARATAFTHRLPLALTNIGIYLRHKPKHEWEEALQRLRPSDDGIIGEMIKSTDDMESSYHDMSILPNDELNERMKDNFGKDFSELRHDLIITNEDVKEDFSTSERAFKDTVYIYCEDLLQYSFASHLSMDFRRKCIDVFVNCKETPDEVKSARALVVILSKGIFSSELSLDKLVNVLLWQRKTRQLVVPVFYDISPSDAVWKEHKWSSALQELKNTPGHQSREDCSDRELVDEIVRDVYEKLFPAKQFGVNSRLVEIEQLLCKQPWGIRRVGIWGMPGIGKTTLAKAFFDQIAGGYEASCFIKQFDRAFHEKGLHCLLDEHFGKMLKELPRVCNIFTRPSLPREKISKKRTLVVLDDVQNPLDAECFIRGFHWFGPGSLIIITSSDKHVFRHCQINHVYEVQSLNKNDSLKLFFQCALGKDIRDQYLMELAMEVIDYANGNPLALRFFGKELKGKTLSEMKTRFLELKLRTPYPILDLFKRSYERLDDDEKNIFLDIACFFNGENVEYVMQLLEGCGFFPHVGIDTLVEKCLVTISENRVNMNRIIQDVGREISNRETEYIERRRRLWETRTIKFLLEDDKLEENGNPEATCKRALGTEDIEGIFLDTSDLIFDVKPTAFDNMINLRFLKIYCSSYAKQYGLFLPKGLGSLPHELRLLHWDNYPLQSLPLDFDPCHLVELNMCYSQLQKLWGETRNLGMLKIVRLCHSQELTEIEDICKAQNVELIDLQGCTVLPSFPTTCQLHHLRVLNLSGCREIKSFPEVSPNIEELHLQGTGIRELPNSVVTESSDALNAEQSTSLFKVVSSNHQHLGKLVSLNMKDCSCLQSLPDMIDLESLKVLHLSGCSQLKDIKGFPRNLKELYLACTAVEKLPQLPRTLQVLNSHGCVSLKSITFGFNQVPKYCTFSDCFALSKQVVVDILARALADLEDKARAYELEQELNGTLVFSLCVPSLTSSEPARDLEPGSSLMMQQGPSSRSELLGFVIFFEVAVSEYYHEAIVFDVRCVRTWKDKKGVSHKQEQTIHCWTPGEEGLGKFQKKHLFVSYDLNVHPFSGKGEDFADVVRFEFFPVNDKQEKLLDGMCTVTKCGIYGTRDEFSKKNQVQGIINVLLGSQQSKGVQFGFGFGFLGL